MELFFLVITRHELLIGDSREIKRIPSQSIDLVVTSPPYPMIEMWDGLFSELNSEIGEELSRGNGLTAFELMHRELDKTWKEVFRVLKKGGIACINVGDATRKIGEHFTLYPNHARIIQEAIKIGFESLPLIIWRKPTNSPTKFMGSGMLPPNAYVTLEHEYILILRKKGRRKFETPEEKKLRRQSGFFWEERNKWFSDVWDDVGGVSQFLSSTIDNTRKRSAAFPLELAYRLINMFSIYGNTVLDPFLGTGTTMIAAIISGRNSVGIEIDNSLYPVIEKNLFNSVKIAEQRLKKRIKDHLEFIEKHEKELKYTNHIIGMPVKTKQETEIHFYRLKELVKVKNDDEKTEFMARYDKNPKMFY